MGETYYDVLGVDPDATRGEIESAYRERVLETHPDHNDAPDASEQFQRVSTAKSVLTDDAERARYDRLGHDAYVRLGEHDSPADSSDRTAASESATGTATAGGRSTGSTARSRGAATGTDGTTTSGNQTGSHHARQRHRRRREKARQQATNGWSFGGDDDRAGESGPDPRTRGTTAGSTDDDDTDDSQYSVHGWGDDVDLEWEGRSIDQSTAVILSCIAALYPVFIYASLTPGFPTVANAVVGLCTLALVAYVLTMPRIATAIFGGWSVLLPIGLWRWSPVDPVSILGLVAIGAVWIPFGYAVVLWWALRP